MEAEFKGTRSAEGVTGRAGRLQPAEEGLDEPTVNPGVKAYMELQRAILAHAASKTGFPTGCVYHYTCFPGLLGILEAGQVWASDTRFMNDRLELEYGRRILTRKLDKLGEEMADVTTPLEHWSRGPTYACCFSALDDSLPQWRSYGEGGVALGLDATSLRDSDWRLYPVLYGEDAEELIEYAVEQWTGQCSALEWVQKTTVLMLIESLVLPMTKHPSFAEEVEWRALYQPMQRPSDLRFRPTKSGVVPFVAMSIPEGSAREIVVGPGATPDVSCASLEELAVHLGLSLDIRQSETPYRTW